MSDIRNNADNNKSILALDDESDIITLIEMFMQRNGYTVDTFTDPLIALECFNSNFKDYSMVISDIRLPTMNGYEFVKKVRQIKTEVKVILMTAFEISDIEFSNFLSTIKIDAFLQKPFSMKQLKQVVEKHLDS